MTTDSLTNYYVYCGQQSPGATEFNGLPLFHYPGRVQLVDTKTAQGEPCYKVRITHEELGNRYYNGWFALSSEDFDEKSWAEVQKKFDKDRELGESRYGKGNGAILLTLSCPEGLIVGICDKPLDRPIMTAEGQASIETQYLISEFIPGGSLTAEPGQVTLSVVKREFAGKLVSMIGTAPAAPALAPAIAPNPPATAQQPAKTGWGGRGR